MKKKFIMGALITLFLILFGRFIYYNIIIPWPFRHELRACLQAADILSVTERDAARNTCFRTYPHFL